MTDISLEVFNWVISLRSDTLTSFFKVFPYLATDSFYILTIAVGYWRWPRNRVFWDLGFLIPASTLINCTLKNFFAIPRPDISLHLIPVRESFGFPSGDVQVAVVFWGMLCLAQRSLGLSLVASGLILAMMMSRLYLGVHSFYDVTGGLLLGIITLWVYHRSLAQSFVSAWFSGKTQSYWMLIFCCVVSYSLASLPYAPTPMIVAAFGTLFGYGVFLESLPSKTIKPEGKSLPLILISLGVLLVVALGVPVVKDHSSLVFWGTGLVKYAFLAVLVFSLLPRFQRWVTHFQKM